MCDEMRCAEDVAHALQDPSTRGRAFSLLTSAETDPEFDLPCVATLVESLTEFIDAQNQWEKLQAWTCLQKLASWYPSVVIKRADRIEHRTANLEGTDLDRLGQLIKTLVATPINVGASFSTETLLALRDASDASVRAAAVELLAKQGSYESLRRIDEIRSYEVPRVASTAEEGVAIHRDKALERLENVSNEESDTIDIRDADRVISYLSRHCPNRLNGESDRLLALLGTEACDTAVTAIASLLANQSVQTDDLRSHLVEAVLSIDDDSTQQDQKEAEQGLESLLLADALNNEVVDMVELWGAV